MLVNNLETIVVLNIIFRLGLNNSIRRGTMNRGLLVLQRILAT
jgi:hypothetical protein